MSRHIFKKPPKLMYVGLNTACGWLRDAHSHGFSEVLFVKEGRGKIEVEKRTYPLTRGDIAVIGAGLNHREFFDEGQEKTLVFFAVDNLNISGGDANSILKDEKFCIIPCGDAYEIIDAALARLMLETEADLPFCADVSDNLVELVLTLLLRLTAFDSELLKQRSHAYREAKDYFDKNYTNMDTLQEVCKNLYINRFYLTHIFKEEEGMPPVKYLILKRMEKAMQLLAATDDDINDIAANCGYVDPAYFCRVFKKTQGCTPLQYRFRIKEERRAEQQKQR